MRVLSARVAHARRDRRVDVVHALVALTVQCRNETVYTMIPIAAPARACGAAPLRERLLGAAKLSFATLPQFTSRRRAA